MAVALPVLLGLLLAPLRGDVNLVSDMMLFLLMTVVVSLVGGLRPALVSAVIGSVLINYFFTPPLHTLSVKDPNNALALFVFLSVAMLVSSVVDLAARRTRQAARRRRSPTPWPTWPRRPWARATSSGRCSSACARRSDSAR